MDSDIASDSRFAHILKDPKFRKLSKKHVKVKIDKRFQSMFTEKKFHIKYKVDKRGRPVKIGGSEDLKQYYEVSESENEEEKKSVDFCKEEEEILCKDNIKGINKENKEEKIKKKVDSKKKAGNENSNDLLIKNNKTLPNSVKKKLKDLTVDYARGEGTIFSDSSSEEDSSDSENSNQTEFLHEWGELDKDAEHTDKSTNRLAVCNMDWDRIEATDLMVLFNSFLTSGSVIHSVDIYPSEFGLQRMKEEDEKGPIELQQDLPQKEEFELSQIQMEKLRKYQLNRLKYYYAVVTCDSPETADILYKECDGLEYESSSSKLDLRYIPDDMTFDQKPKERCTCLPDFSIYKPRLFTTSALTKAKVDLTWDEGDPNREEVVKSIHSGKIDEKHLRKYLACSSSEDENCVEDSQENIEDKSKEQSHLEKYKALLMDIKENEKKNKKNDINMEVSWNLDLEKKTTSVIEHVVKEKSKKTPFQQYLEKKREKKKKKQMERKALLAQVAEKSDESAFSDDDIPSDIDLNDPYFKEEIDLMKTKKSYKKKEIKKVEDTISTQKKAELELLMLDDEDNRHFNIRKIEENEKQNKKKLKKGQKRKVEELKDNKDDFKIDVNDERFSAIYTSHHFNIDPADPQFKSTKASRLLIEEKLKRREKEETDILTNQKSASERNLKSSYKNPELSLLVKNIKKNTDMINKKSCYS